MSSLYAVLLLVAGNLLVWWWSARCGYRLGRLAALKERGELAGRARDFEISLQHRFTGALVAGVALNLYLTVLFANWAMWGWSLFVLFALAAPFVVSGLAKVIGMNRGRYEEEVVQEQYFPATHVG